MKKESGSDSGVNIRVRSKEICTWSGAPLSGVDVNPTLSQTS